MNVAKVKKDLQTLKIHLDEMERWVSQTSNMIYEIEENILDMEERQWFEKYQYPIIMKNFITGEACSA